MEDLSVEWEIVPSGCSGWVQPTDVNVGEPHKNGMCCKWEEWMMTTMETDGNRHLKHVDLEKARQQIAK